MPLELDGVQKRRLREALLDAYIDWDKTERLVSDEMNERLASITSENNDLEQVMFDLIDWAEARGRLSELMIGAVSSNPGNAKLFVFSQKLGLSSTDARKATLEKVVSGNSQFFDVAKWRAQLQRNEWRVCRVDFDGVGVGTGFLVGPNAVLTNHHVVTPAIAGERPPGRYSVRFDYKETESAGVLNPGTVVDLADEWLLDSSPHSEHDVEVDKTGEPGPDELDFALLQLAEDIGERPVAGDEPRGWVELPKGSVAYESVKGIFILQHPMRLPMKLAMGTDETITVNAARNRFRYAVPTEGGSSGSPVFNSDWDIIGLHHMGDPDSLSPSYNEAIAIDKIAEREAVAAYLAKLEAEE
ncbi:MAG: serine protease [Acidimicrobiia bacterium]|nr:serine protease [Acidimicrobiia bacterium]